MLESGEGRHRDTDLIVFLFKPNQEANSSCTLSPYYVPGPVLVFYILGGRREYPHPTGEETEAGPRSRSLQVVSGMVPRVV